MGFINLNKNPFRYCANLVNKLEGHTDSKQLLDNGSVLEDNWDLSVKRATTVVRILQDTYGLDPKRMTAAGRGEYAPVVDNDNAENRAKNRRTEFEIIDL